MVLKACIFDFDGTLGDSMWVWEAVIGVTESHGQQGSYSEADQILPVGNVASRQSFPLVSRNGLGGFRPGEPFARIVSP